MTDTWATRDLPVLRAIVALADKGRDMLQSHELAEWTGMDHAHVVTALFALAHEQPPLFTYQDAADYEERNLVVVNPTGEARRRVGTWPTPDSLAEAIVAAFEHAAKDEPDAERRSKLGQLAKSLTGVGSGVLTGVTTAVINGSLGV